MSNYPASCARIRRQKSILEDLQRFDRIGTTNPSKPKRFRTGSGGARLGPDAAEKDCRGAGPANCETSAGAEKGVGDVLLREYATFRDSCLFRADRISNQADPHEDCCVTAEQPLELSSVNEKRDPHFTRA